MMLTNTYRMRLSFYCTVLAAICLIGTVRSDRAQTVEIQLQNLLEKCRNKSIGMLTNPTSTDGNQKPLFQRILDKAEDFNITFKCFFAPEHGLRGDRQDGKGDEDYIDQDTGIIVYSLYGVRKAPTTAQLRGLDILIYDIQDVGARYYTYIWSLTYTIEVLPSVNVKLLIFDRPNPLGRKVEGCPLTEDYGLIGRLLPGQSFSFPIRYGLTIGEVIGYLTRYLPPFDFEVLTMGESMYEIREQEWVMSSPNMPSLTTVHVYAGMGIIEGTSISEGRGTTKPFQLTGYPGIDSHQLVSVIENKTEGKGVSFREAYIIPTTNKHQGKVCGGVEVMPKGLSEGSYDYDSVQTAIVILQSYIQLDPEIRIEADAAFGSIGFSQHVRKYSAQQILANCKSQRDQYVSESKKYWLYPDPNSKIGRKQHNEKEELV